MKRILCLSALLFACAPAEEGGRSTPEPDGDFRFETSSEQELKLLVTLDGQPASGVYVQVTDVAPAPIDGEPRQEATTGALYFQGYTDERGLVEATLFLPASVRKVDLLVDHPNARGPFTHAELREIWGPFAPSARWTVRSNRCDDVRVQLQEV